MHPVAGWGAEVAVTFVKVQQQPGWSGVDCTVVNRWCISSATHCIWGVGLLLPPKLICTVAATFTCVNETGITVIDWMALDAIVLARILESKNWIIFSFFALNVWNLVFAHLHR